MSTFSDDDSDSTKELGGKYDSDYDSDVDMCIKDDVDTLYGIDCDGDVDMETDSDDEDDDNEQQEDEKEEEEEDVDEDQEEDEDEDEDDGKEPWTIGQGEMVNTTADNVDTMVDDDPTVPPEQHQEMREDTSQRQPPAPAPRPQMLKPYPQPWSPETHPLSGLEFLGLVTPEKPRPAAPTLQEAEAAGITTDVYLDEQLLSELAGGNRLPDVPHLNVPLCEVRRDGLVGMEWMIPRFAEEEWIRVRVEFLFSEFRSL